MLYDVKAQRDAPAWPAALLKMNGRLTRDIGSWLEVFTDCFLQILWSLFDLMKIVKAFSPTQKLYSRAELISPICSLCMLHKALLKI